MNNDITVKNPKLTLKALICDKNRKPFSDLIQNRKFCEATRVNWVWLSEDAMLEVEMSVNPPSAKGPKEVFVIPKFENFPLFHHLDNLGHYIWSNWVIEYCVQYFAPLPIEKRLLYSFAFDTVISMLSSGLDHEQKILAESRIKLMGGQIAAKFSSDVTILIATDCESTIEYRKHLSSNTQICSIRVVEYLWNTSAKHVSEFVDPQKRILCDVTMELEKLKDQLENRQNASSAKCKAIISNAYISGIIIGIIVTFFSMQIIDFSNKLFGNFTMIRDFFTVFFIIIVLVIFVK